MRAWHKKHRTKKWYAYVAISLAAILFTLSIQSFVQTSKTLTAGVSAFALAPTLLIDELKPFVGPIYLVLNIPIILFFYKKIKKDFIKRTILFLLVQSASGSLFLIPEVQGTFDSLIIPPEKVLSEEWPIFILASIGGFFAGASIALAWKFGGSSAGGDIFSYYYSYKYKKPVGSISFIVSLIFVTISFAVTIGISEEIRDKGFAILLATLCYVGISSLMINIFYPRYSTIFAEIHSNKIDKISKYFKDSKYTHSWQVIKIRSGYMDKDTKMISTAMLLLEVKPIVAKIKEIDPNAWISITKIRNIIGNFSTDYIN